VNWSDEHYVKLYTRETLTWRCWGWQARTLFLHMLKRCDGTGLIESGNMTPAEALTVQLELPAEVVTFGLDQLVASGTVELIPRAVLLPKFIEAQEARKSEAQKKRDHRERERNRRRAGQVVEVATPHVPTTSPDVTSGHQNGPSVPSPAQPSPLKAPAKVKAPSLAQQLWAWAQDRRAEKGLETEAPWSVVQLNAKLKPKLEHHGRPALEAKYRAYLAVEKHKALTPPWAFAMFIACADSLPTVTAVTEEPRSRSL
jgi:hypothetical protein